MPDIFVNYRTGDGENAAVAIANELARRFGPDRVFRDSRSIRPGDDYVDGLMRGVLTSKVLLAVIGGRWLAARDGNGRNALDNEQDWIRREILAAFDAGIRVVPVLVGEGQPALDAAALPPVLRRLARCQSRRFTHRDAEVGLHALGNHLLDLVPGLVDLDEPAGSPDPTQQNTAADAGQAIQQAGDHARQFSGGIAGAARTVIVGSSGPVNTGSGNQYNGRDMTFGVPDTGPPRPRRTPRGPGDGRR